MGTVRAEPVEAFSFPLPPEEGRPFDKLRANGAGLDLLSAHDPQNVAFLHDQQVLAVEADLGAGPFTEQDLVAGLDVERGHLAVFGTGARADGDDLAFLRLFLGGVGGDDAAGGFLGGCDAAHEHAVVKGAECHGVRSSRWIATKSSLHKREPALPICDWHSRWESDNIAYVGVSTSPVKPGAALASAARA